ncbi:MAG TPA: PQQ-binding-like beta-propeller repeat protein [Rhodothermales bacterium]|nr:PQQ-binding-like beta-propeller repeat protein [Rhodothermales bacterium]
MMTCKHALRFTLLAALLFLIGTVETAQAQALPMFRGGLRHAGVYEGQPVEQGNQVRWTFQTDGPVRSTPALVDGTLYVGSGDGKLYAIDAATGNEQWRFETQGAIHASPAVADGRVYVSSRDQHLYAVDAQTGRKIWQFAMGTDLPYVWGFDMYLSSPTVVEGLVYVGSGDGHVYAVKGATGQVTWSFDAGARVRSSPAFADGIIYVGAMNGRLYGLDAATGQQKMVFKTEGASLDPADFGFDRQAVVSSPAVDGGRIFFGGRDGYLYAVDAQTGQQQWQFNYEVSWVLSSPAVADGAVYAGTSDGRFVNALDAATGEEQWRLATPSIVWSSPSVAGDLVYFGCGDGFLYALDRQTGEEQWRFRTGGGVYSSPVIAQGTVYVGSDDGVLYAITDGPEAPAMQPTSHRAVYWSADASYKWFRAGMDQYIRDYFAAEGYEVLNDSSLAGFMQKHLTDTQPSVVVFATNLVPATVVADTSEAALLRRYLNAGGKAVWLGATPLAFAQDRATGRVTGLDFSIPERILGIQYGGPDTRGVGGFYGASVTDDGKRWGLRGWWVGNNALAPEEVTTVLARNEYGQAQAWVKNYRGSEGTGLVQLWLPRDAPADLTTVKAVAEYGLK